MPSAIYFIRNLPLGLTIACVLFAVIDVFAAPRYQAVDVNCGRRIDTVHWGPRRAGERLDLFIRSGNTVHIWWQSERGFETKPTEVLRLPNDPGLVDFGDVIGDGGHEVVVVSRRGVFADNHRADLEQRRSGAGGIFGNSPRATDPGGVFVRLSLERSTSAGRGGPVTVGFEHVTARFLRDLDADGLVDLVVPRQRRYELYFRRGEKFTPAMFLRAEHHIGIFTGGPEIIDPLRMDLEVPVLEFKDLNGDDHIDIVVAYGQHRRFYLQEAGGFPTAPSYELDLAQFGAAAPGREEPATKRTFQFMENRKARATGVDIDRDGCEDYLVSSERAVRIYFGSKDGPDFSRPHIARKLSGDLQGVGSYDIDNDGTLDLVALKFRFPSIARFIAAYFVPMSLDFEVLGYLNRGGRSFSRRPERRNVLRLKVPALRTILEGFDEFSARFLNAVSRRGRFASGDIDGDGSRDGVFVDEDDRLRIFYARGEDIQADVGLGELFFEHSKNEWELQELLDYVSGAAHEAARAQVKGRTPDLELPLSEDYHLEHDVVELRDLNVDGHQDMILVSRESRLKIFLSIVR